MDTLHTLFTKQTGQHVDVDLHTKETAALLTKWHNHPDSAPSLVELCTFGLGIFPKDTYCVKDAHPVFVAAKLGQEPSNLPFHNNNHYRHVLLQTLRLIATHNNIYISDFSLSPGEASLLMIAACIHDYKHDGQAPHHPAGFLEWQSFKHAAPHLEKAGLSQTRLKNLKTMLLSTSVKPHENGPGYNAQLKSVYRYHFMGGAYPANIDQDLQGLLSDKRLTLLSMLLHEADIMTSAGVTYDISKRSEIRFCTENNIPEAKPSNIVWYMENICNVEFLTQAGHILGQQNIETIYQQAKTDVENGDQPFHLPPLTDRLAPKI